MKQTMTCWLLLSVVGRFVLVVSVLVGQQLLGAELFVDLNSTAPTPPYADWSTAATNIQVAIDAASAGDTVWVTNGVYATGGKVMAGDLLNRVALDKALKVQSVNGPSVTVIQGFGPTNGPTAVRPVWLTNGAALSGFTLRGGATRGVSNPLVDQKAGGGVYGTSKSAIVTNCVITNNLAAFQGGGAYRVTLNNTTLIGNQAVGSGSPPSDGTAAGRGGGAANCDLSNCLLIGNLALQENGGGAANCNLKNCALTKNDAGYTGGAAISGTLVNCTISGNNSRGIAFSGPTFGADIGAVVNASLNNCIVFGNLSFTDVVRRNYYNCTFNYCDTEPVPPGEGNISIDPQLLADGYHLSETSPCRGAGTNNVITGLDIDGHAWSNPPSMGCDEWMPFPIIVARPAFQVISSKRALIISASVAGQTPFTYSWSKEGTLIEDGEHYESSGTANVVVKSFDVPDQGVYQVVVSNSFRVVTSEVAQVVIHCVDASGLNPVQPFTNWDNAATTIQDAIDIALPGEIVLATNGIYSTGGRAVSGDLTNRIAVTKPLIVASMNGYKATVIQGAWDPMTNGPLAVRCAWLTNGAFLGGFTLTGGATRSTGDVIADRSGGGVNCYGNPTAVIAHCLIYGNAAANSGGGVYQGNFNNCAIMRNSAAQGSGVFDGTLNHCTVVENYSASPLGRAIYNGSARNCIIYNNKTVSITFPFANYPSSPVTTFLYCDSFPLPSGFGNISADPQLLDGIHLSVLSPCRTNGSALYTTDADIDGQPWANPPSMGCSEAIEASLIGPLSVALSASQTNLFVNRADAFTGLITGRASRIEWSFGDGPLVTNTGYATIHTWSNAGDYNTVFTAYNNDNPGGIFTNLMIHVAAWDTPTLQLSADMTGGFQFDIPSQAGGNYIVQTSSNLAPPIIWNTLRTINNSPGGLLHVVDPFTNAVRYYRVGVQ